MSPRRSWRRCRRAPACRRAHRSPRRPPNRRPNNLSALTTGRIRCAGSSKVMAVSLGELAVRFGCELRGDPQTLVERVATLANADQHALAFLANPRYRTALAGTHAAAVVLDAHSAGDCP